MIRLHHYSHEDGTALVMTCGAISDFPEHSARYMDQLKAFKGLDSDDQCGLCKHHLKLQGRLS